MPKRKLTDIYLESNIEAHKNNFLQLKKQYYDIFKASPARFFSCPGRTEISGNHTDHNNGKVIAASINLDTKAVVSKTDSTIVKIISEGFPEPFIVDISDSELKKEEKETTNALIRGIAARLNQLDYKTGGFNAVMKSDVLQGSGLSSSASVEVLVAAVFNNLFNNGKIPNEELAKISQYAENQYFGKPCGLMDQMACAIGNIIAIDFRQTDKPEVTRIKFDFNQTNYKLIVLDTGANHADLTEDYAAIPREMAEIADFFGKNNCREIDETAFISALPELKEKVNQRGILRTLHFFNENKRVDKQVVALENQNIDDFLSLVKESGNSSFKYLQNIYTPKNYKQQEVSLALALTEIFLKTINDGACRIHGGGFAGTIQIFLPSDRVKEYINYITPVFSPESARVLSIRPVGVTELEVF